MPTAFNDYNSFFTVSLNEIFDFMTNHIDNGQQPSVMFVPEHTDFVNLIGSFN